MPLLEPSYMRRMSSLVARFRQYLVVKQFHDNSQQLPEERSMLMMVGKVVLW